MLEYVREWKRKSKGKDLSMGDDFGTTMKIQAFIRIHLELLRPDELNFTVSRLSPIEKGYVGLHVDSRKGICS